MAREQINLNDAAERPEGIPLFPLPNITLFPNQQLPLHIFEPRYRAMLSDILASDRLIVMARLSPHGLKSERPAIFPVAGLGCVRSSERQADGRSLILVEGLSVVRIESEVDEGVSPYRRGRGDLIDRIQGVAEESLREPLSALLSLCSALFTKMGRPADVLSAHLARYPDLFDKLEVLAAIVTPGPSSKQRLLEMENPIQRCDFLLELVARMNAGSELN